MLFRGYCFRRENSLSFWANSVSPAKNSVSSLLHTKRAERNSLSLSPELGEGTKLTELGF